MSARIDHINLITGLHKVIRKFAADQACADDGHSLRTFELCTKPRRIVILEFPSVAEWEAFYTGPVYQGLKEIRDECSSARLVSVEGIEP